MYRNESQPKLMQVSIARGLFILRSSIERLITKSLDGHAKKFMSKLLLAILALGAAQSTLAQRVQPMVYELAPSGSDATQSLRIENSKSTPVTLEFVASKIILDENGRETNESAEDDFLIFPPQALIQPGKTQLVRVKYVGNPDLEQSKAYRISVKQLPVTLDKSGSTGVAMLVNFNTLANVVPKSAKPSLAITDISAADNGMWSITVENTGDRYARLSKTEWTVESTDGSAKPMRLKKDQVGGLTELNLILPNSKLTQLIRALDGFDPTTTRITIDAKS